MFNRKTLLLVIAATASAGAHAVEPSRFSWGLDYLSYEGLNYTSNLGLNLAYDYNEYLAVQGSVARSVTNASGITVTTAGLYARGNLRFDKIGVFGLLGVSSVDDSVGSGITDVTYGFGLDLYGSPDTSLTFTVMQYEGVDWDDTSYDDNFSFSAIALGFKSYFDIPSLGKRY